MISPVALHLPGLAQAAVHSAHPQKQLDRSSSPSSLATPPCHAHCPSLPASIGRLHTQAVLKFRLYVRAFGKNAGIEASFFVI